jgi:RNA polymerase sigma factor (sigma-70 family)
MDSESVKMVARWRGGDQQAAAELFARYAERLINLTGRQLSAQLAVRVDPQDVVQSVFCSFFVGARDGSFVLQRSGDLWNLLVTITLHKVRRQVEFHTAQKRSPSAERGSGRDLAELLAQIPAVEPSPAEVAALADTLAEVFRGLQPVQRRMLELRLQGHTLTEIVAETRHSQASVQRLLDRVKRQLAQADGPKNNTG